MVYTPNLQLVRYTGETPRKLWEVKARQTPVLQKGDLVLLDNVVAVLMVKKYGFEMVDNSLLTLKGVTPYDFKDLDIKDEDIKDLDEDGENFANENQAGDGEDEILSDTKDTGSTDEVYQLPNFEELESLDIESVKKALAYVGVKAGNRNIDTLKQLLMPYLPKGE